MTNNSDHYRQKITDFMEKRGLKLRPWCERADVSDGTMRAWLKGDTNSITLETLSKLAKAEGVTVSQVLGESDRTSVEMRHLSENELFTVVSLEVEAGLRERGQALELKDKIEIVSILVEMLKARGDHTLHKGEVSAFLRLVGGTNARTGSTG